MAPCQIVRGKKPLITPFKKTSRPPGTARCVYLFHFGNKNALIKDRRRLINNCMGYLFCINHCTKFGYPPEYAGKEFGINTPASPHSHHLFRSSLRKSGRVPGEVP
jgi:hypothetical protein